MVRPSCGEDEDSPTESVGSGIGWDDPVSTTIHDAWAQWRSELPTLTTRSIPRSKKVNPTYGFSDAS